METDPYSDDLLSVVERIGGICTDCPWEKTGEEAPLKPEDFRRPKGGFTGISAAIDGSNSMVLESGSFSVAAIRAAYVAFRSGMRVSTKTTPLRLPQISGSRAAAGYSQLYEECFGVEPENPIDDDPSRAASVFRDTLEYWTAAEVIPGMDKGDCLMLDGGLRAGHASHGPVLKGIIQDCGNRGIYLISVSKRNSLTWNGYPLGIIGDAIASVSGIKAPWYVEIPDDLPDQKRQEQWQRGRAYIMRLHPASGIVLKAEVPRYADAAYVDAAVSACAVYASDGRIPGYPYPLVEAHRECVIPAETIDIIRQDVIGRISEMGIDKRKYEQIFGDLHDEFARY